MMKTSVSIFVSFLFTALCGSLFGQESKPPDKGSPADQLIEEYYGTRSEGLAKIDQQYLDELNQIQEKVQATGNLELVLQIKNEILAVEKEMERLEQSELVELPIRMPTEQTTDNLDHLHIAQQEADKRKYSGVKLLNTIFLNRTNLLITQWVKEDRIEEAKTLQEFKHKLESELELVSTGIAIGSPERGRIGLPEGTREFEGHSYKVYVLSKKLSRTEAKVLCQKTSGGYLACITSKQEDQFLDALRKEFAANSKLWIGGESHKSDASDAVWINGEKMEYMNFNSISPDHHPFTAYSKAPNWEWKQDRPSSAVHGYICEWD